MSVLFDRPRAEVALGAVHIPGWLPIERQRDLVAACREWAKPPAGIRHTVMPSGRLNITLRESGLSSPTLGLGPTLPTPGPTDA